MGNQPEWVWQLSDWPSWNWDANALSASISQARRAQGEAVGRAKLLIPSMDTQAHGEFLVQEGLNTSAIEGEQLDVDALRSSIARRLGLPADKRSTARPARSVEGLVDVLQDATERFEEPLTLAKLNSWQAALFPTGRSGLHEIHVGELRGPEPMRIVSGPLHRERVHYEAPPRNRLEHQMQLFLEWFNTESIQLDGLIRAGIAHLWFEVLHPYEDGNGRVGRAVLDKALAQDEKRSERVYSISTQLYRVRDEYYTALERASRGLDTTAWLDFFLRQVSAAAQASEQAIGTVLEKARFWMAHGGKPLNERQRKAVNLMLDKGRGGFEGGMTNAKYARLTKASPATAQRDLAGLVGGGMLQLIGGGRGARYDVRWTSDT
jgi:Fic family protein